MTDFLGFPKSVERCRRELATTTLSLIVRAGTEGVLDGDARLHLSTATRSATSCAVPAGRGQR